MFIESQKNDDCWLCINASVIFFAGRWMITTPFQFRHHGLLHNRLERRSIHERYIVSSLNGNPR
ncbi:hypothetical protein CPB83DRAFT_864832 [Crepidotus variabilis]|uniref:Uncharacterized protein n=1 Tax=Crepidotus variabilis TaxID=179855 RepID=A0A9P6E478_9AGAR|nr:hypothetical protein CPB83DRAFT_864832 [Crepidotus variabilis]